MGNRIKILFVIFSLDKGGAEKIFSFLANNINSEKFDVHFLTIRQASGDGYLLDSRLNHISLNYSRVLFSIPAVYKIIQEVKPKLIISTLIPVNIVIGLFKTFGFLKNVKCILRESSIPSINGKFSKNKYFFYNTLISNLYKAFDFIVAQSIDMKKDLIDNYHIKPGKIRVINNPYFETHSQVKTPSQIQKEPGKKLFINIGNLRVEKGQLRLIEAIAGLKGKIQFELWILGDGVMRQELQQRIVELNLADEVKLLGHQNDVLPFLSMADVYVQTSHYEGFPNVLLESLGLGVPVVAYDVLGGTKDILVNGVNGFLVPDGDEEQFVSTMITASTYSFDKEKIKEHVKSSFNSTYVVNQYEDLILEALTL